MRNAGVGKRAEPPFRTRTVAPDERKTAGTGQEFQRAVIRQRCTEAPPSTSNLAQTLIGAFMGGASCGTQSILGTPETETTSPRFAVVGGGYAPSCV